MCTKPVPCTIFIRQWIMVKILNVVPWCRSFKFSCKKITHLLALLTRSMWRWSRSFAKPSQNSLHVQNTGYSSWNRINKNVCYHALSLLASAAWKHNMLSWKNTPFLLYFLNQSTVELPVWLPWSTVYTFNFCMFLKYLFVSNCKIQISLFAIHIAQISSESVSLAITSATAAWCKFVKVPHTFLSQDSHIQLSQVKQRAEFI